MQTNRSTWLCWRRGLPFVLLWSFVLFTFHVTSLAGQGVLNPIPLIDDPLVPTSVVPGGPDFTLTVNGTGFVPGSAVLWNGSALTTTFVSNSQLTATVPASKIATQGTAAVTVANPTPGGGVSNTLFVIASAPGTAPTFTIFPPYSPFAFANSIRSADLNADGKEDLIYLAQASAASAQSSVIVQLGNGDGSFQKPVSYTVGNSAQSLLVADFNGDGKPDLALANTGDNTVSILLGNGDGTFGPGTVFSVLNAPEVLGAGDFNGDGKLDLVVGYRFQDAGDVGGISVLLGNGDGTLAHLVDYEAKTLVFDIVVADFNRDSKLDLALASNLGSGLVIQFLQGNGDGTFRAAVNIPSDANLESLAAADLNGDGKLDLVASDFGGGAFVLLGNGDGTFQSPKQYGAGRTSIGLATADFNADGKLDVALANQNADSFSILLGSGDGTLQNPIDFATTSSPIPIVARDFNGDGKVDLAAISAVGTGPYAAQVFLQGAFPVASASPSSLTFAQQPVGSTSLPQVVTLNNAGAIAFALTGINIMGPNAGDFAETNNRGSTLGPNANCQINVTFTPVAPVNASASIMIVDNAPGSPQPVPLTGSTPPAAVGSLSPQTITFPNQYVGTSGLPATVTVTDTGNATLIVTSVISSPSDFGVLNSCGNSVAPVAPGSSCSIGVFFDPAVAGVRTGTVTITDNAADSPQTVTVSGTGQDFSMASPAPTATVASGQTATYSVSLSPGGGFSQTVSLSCTGAPSLTACNVSPSSVALNGTGITSVTVTVSTTAPAFILPELPRIDPPHMVNFHPVLLFIALLVPALTATKGRHRREREDSLVTVFPLTLLLWAGMTLAACGGSASVPTKPGAQPGTYSLTVTGTFNSGSTTLSHNTKLTLVVQ